MNEMHEFAPLYALDALDEAERLRFEAHLEGCVSCQREVADVLETMAGLVTHEAAPPDRVKGNVMAAIDADIHPDGSPQVPVAAEANGMRVPVECEHLEAAAAAGESSISRNAAGRTWSRALVTLAAATIVVVGFAAAYLLTSRPDAYAELAAADDVEVLDLDGTPGELTLIYSPSRDEIGLSSADLIAPASDETYALWFVFEDGVQPAALFVPDDGQLRETLDVEDVDPSGFGVTVEPAGGSPQPTGEILLIGSRGS